jgi:hypothetical protein
VSVNISVDIDSPHIGKGTVRITAEGIPNDLFVPLAISHLGKDDKRMAELLTSIFSSIEAEDGDESEDEHE